MDPQDDLYDDESSSIPDEIPEAERLQMLYDFVTLEGDARHYSVPYVRMMQYGHWYMQPENQETFYARLKDEYGYEVTEQSGNRQLYDVGYGIPDFGYESMRFMFMMTNLQYDVAINQLVMDPEKNKIKGARDNALKDERYFVNAAIVVDQILMDVMNNRESDDLDEVNDQKNLEERFQLELIWNWVDSTARPEFDDVFPRPDRKSFHWEPSPHRVVNKVKEYVANNPEIYELYVEYLGANLAGVDKGPTDQDFRPEVFEDYAYLQETLSHGWVDKLLDIQDIVTKEKDMSFDEFIHDMARQFYETKADQENLDGDEPDADPKQEPKKKPPQPPLS